MKKLLFRSASFVYFSTAFFVMFSMNAHAYIDPSVTTYLIQAIAAVVIALGALITVFRHKIAAFFKKDKKTERREVHFKDDAEDSAADDNVHKEE